MGTDIIIRVAKNGALTLSIGADHHGDTYDRPTTLVELIKNYPTLYDWLLVALLRLRISRGATKSSDWIQFED